MDSVGSEKETKMTLARRISAGIAASALTAVLVVGGGTAAQAVDTKNAERFCTAPKTGQGYTNTKLAGWVSHEHKSWSTAATWVKYWDTSGVHNSYGPYLNTYFTFQTSQAFSAWQASCF